MLLNIVSDDEEVELLVSNSASLHQIVQNLHLFPHSIVRAIFQVSYIYAQLYSSYMDNSALVITQVFF